MQLKYQLQRKLCEWPANSENNPAFEPYLLSHQFSTDHYIFLCVKEVSINMHVTTTRHHQHQLLTNKSQI